MCIFGGVYKRKLGGNSCHCKINHNICNINTVAFRKDTHWETIVDYFVNSLLVCLPGFSGSLKWTQVAKLSPGNLSALRSDEIVVNYARGIKTSRPRLGGSDGVMLRVCVSRTWGHIIDCRASRTHEGGRSLAETSQTITCLGFIKTRTQIEPPAGLRLKDWQLILLANGETSTKGPVGGSQGFSPAEALIALQAATWHSENTGDVWEYWSVGERNSKVLMMAEARGGKHRVWFINMIHQFPKLCRFVLQRLKKW